MTKQNAPLRIFGGRCCAIGLAAGLVALVGCGGGGGGGGGSDGTPPVNNTQPVQVNAGPANNATDVLFTSVTVCVPGSSNCQTIPDVAVDTGSSGLRLLASALTLPLTAVTDSGGNPLGNCISFADNSYVWGPVESADVQMADETASSVPIQIIGDSSFPGVPASCNSGGTADDTVSTLGANGLLGVSVFQQDCGPACAPGQNQIPIVYFSCPSSSPNCSVAAVPVEKQLQNPVWLFSGKDNNGLLISLPSVPADGAPSVSGSMIFGIGTQSNNALGTAQVYATDNIGNFSTTYHGNVYTDSFIDSGSNGLYFLDHIALGIADCTNFPGFYCPQTALSDTATNTGANNASGQVSFTIANAATLFAANNGTNVAFNNLGGENPMGFDWGLPFFFGRKVFVGIENQSTPAGPGPYWAY
jgi:hypothetical protein